jgi:hypothetical protein
MRLGLNWGAAAASGYERIRSRFNSNQENTGLARSFTDVSRVPNRVGKVRNVGPASKGWPWTSGKSV